MQNISNTLQILLVRFDGQLLIPFIAAARAAGFKDQTARNLLVAKKFPIRSEKRGARRVIHIFDLANHIESILPEQIKRGPGRPKKNSGLQAGSGEGVENESYRHD